MPELLPGVLLMVLAPLLLAVKPRSLFAAGVLALPVLSWLAFSALPVGSERGVGAHGLTLTLWSIDGTSWLWATVFHAAAFLGALYSLGDAEDRITPVAGLMYAGAAILAVCAGDLVTLFIGWELTGVFSVPLIWARGGPSAYRAGLRYLAWQVGSGVLLLAGVLWRADAGLPLDVAPIDPDSAGAWLLLAAVGIKVCLPGVHTWLTRAYPEATPGGTVFLSAFTTKMAIYALLRMYAGLELLIPLGLVMAVGGLVMALRTDDIRRMLAYVLVNQLGFMVVAIGIGTDLALAGVAALAVVHILYKSLLFMTTGAVLHRTGTARASALGGLAAAMPWTAVMYLAGAWSHLPGLAGYASKSLITTAAGEAHLTVAFLVLEATTAGMVLVVGVHLPWMVFWRPGDPDDTEPAPLAMKGAMGLVAAVLLLFGVWPAGLWDALPYGFDRAELSPYTVHHALSILQLSAGAAFAYFGLRRFGAFRVVPRSSPRDVDGLDRVVLPWVAGRVGTAADIAWQAVREQVFRGWEALLATGRRNTGPGSRAAATFTTRSGALSMAVLLTLYAVLFFTRGSPAPLETGGSDHGAEHGAAASHHAGDDHGAAAGAHGGTRAADDHDDHDDHDEDGHGGGH